MERAFHGKIIIDLGFKLMTGTQIGNANEGFEIGGVDKVVVRDPVSRLPIVPGSSLKGKLRAISEAITVPAGRQATADDWYNRHHGNLVRHEADNRTEALKHPVDRVFGTSGKTSKDDNHPSRLSVSDAHMTSETANVLADLESSLMYTELKSENFLDRITSAAMPRQIERVPAGCVFRTRLSYTVENPKDLTADFEMLLAALQWLEDDYIGGSGSRGYGRIRFGVVPESDKLPLDTIPSADIRVSLKSRAAYLKGESGTQWTCDSLPDLRSKLSELVKTFAGQ